jgi:hypothetical protein
MSYTRTSLVIDPPTYRRFVDLARRNERSTSAELRVAIRRHLAESPAAAAADGLAGPVPASGGSAAAGSETLDGAKQRSWPGVAASPSSSTQADGEAAD